MSNTRLSRRRARLRLLPESRKTETADSTVEIDHRDQDPTDTAPPAPDGPDVEPDDVLDNEIDGVDDAGKTHKRSGERLAILASLTILAVLTGLVGWTGYHAYMSHRSQQQRNLFLHNARQAALNLTTIDYTEADADVHRILDSATGNFYDAFQKQYCALRSVNSPAYGKNICAAASWRPRTVRRR